jgi:NADH-quinone oxidoreductase subunit L
MSVLLEVLIQAWHRTDTLDTLPFLVLLLPLLGFIVLALLGDAINRDREQKGATIVACTLVVLSFLFAVRIAVRLPEGARRERSEAAQQIAALAQKGVRIEAPVNPPLTYDPQKNFYLIDVADLRIPIKLLIDPLSVTLLLVVTGIGSLIHIYSLGYMSHDPERVRYFSYLNLFTFFMLVLVLSASLPLMFVGWEGVGLCSYLLIGFWFKKKSASDAGKKAFIVNRIGDAGLILGMALAFQTFGTLDLVTIVDNAQPSPASTVRTDVQGLSQSTDRIKTEALGEVGVVTGICLLLFVGACGKSAQIPLHVWLPDAMEGPTPVSALIHAATMVTAGVYMVARLGPLYLRSETALAVIAVVGTTTALMAATVALVQTDIKKVLAYSTVSQLGYMFLACGVGAFSVGVFHLFTHAFFKALLFLGSGSVIHALSGEQDLRKMGGLFKKIPVTAWTFLIGTVAIAGIPPFAGFYSKDAILEAAYQHHHPVLFAVALLTALLTAFYMTRLFILAFVGPYRGALESGAAHAPAPIAADSHAKADDHGHGDGHGGIHESPWSMLVPLILLAIGSAVVGKLVPIPEILGAAPVDTNEAAAPPWLPFLATATALVGILAAYYLYVMYTDVPRRIGERFAGVRRALEAKWYFDDAYNWFASHAVVDGSREVLYKAVDASVIDGAVNGTGALAAALAERARRIQSGLVRGYVLLILGGAVGLLGYLLWLR